MIVKLYAGTLGSEKEQWICDLTPDNCTAFKINSDDITIPSKGELISVGVGIESTVYVVQQVLFDYAIYDDDIADADCEPTVILFVSEYNWE